MCPDIMSIKEAADYLFISPDSLYNYANVQKVPAFRIGNRWHFSKGALDLWMEQQSSRRIA